MKEREIWVKNGYFWQNKKFKYIKIKTKIRMTNYVLVIRQRVILNIKGAPRNQRKD